MALHMKTLEIEFSLYLPSLTDMQKAILKQTIIELYNQFGIFWETDIRQLKATDFPILSDLHALLEKKAEANKENPVYRDLATAFCGTATPRWRLIPGLFAWIPTTCKMRRIMSNARSI